MTATAGVVAKEAAEKTAARKATSSAGSNTLARKHAATGKHRAVETTAPKHSGEKTLERQERKHIYSETKSRVKAAKRTDEYKAVAGAKRSVMPHIRPAKSTVRYRHIMTVEIIVGSILILTNVDSNEPSSFSKRLEQEVAFLIAFAILATMTTMGPSSARLSAALGGLIVLTIAVKQKDPIRRLVPKNIKSSIDSARGGSIEHAIGLDTSGG